MLSIHQLSFSYNRENSFLFPDIQCDKGEECMVMGPSGCGKTTLLHLIAGLLRPSSGEIKVAGHIISELPSAQVDRIRGKEIGIIFQVPYFIASLTAIENVMIASYLNGIKPINKREIFLLLDRLHIAEKAHVYVNELSQGELQRLSIARALINKPSLLLADEPTSSLDDFNCEATMALLREQAQETGASLLIVTHDQRLNGSVRQVVHLTSPTL